ncbi:hypothetical protein CTAYLR_009442 [Chrysophaeum taylorii]|uniref:GST N-terminal domain-containing protein n=1 Tax=Chrysophaeum taylorii TaxID=2483200 RepID=A0AAD7U7Z9_9STRA|nr:hypothetical protein CTAYLR_009442 [Chrysophaeum taylorii]
MMRVFLIVAGAEALGDLFGRPAIAKPKNFVAPEPKPLQVTRSEQVPALLSGSVALALRLATGTFVLGWKPVSLEVGPLRFGRPLDPADYALRLGPIAFRDEGAPGLRSPSRPLVLYEYESSPFCRKVREAACVLNVPLEMRPCPGARDGFSDELERLTGRRTVPYLRDPNAGVDMFESEEIIDYLFDTYGSPKSDPKALWPLRGSFALWTAAFAALARGLPCSKRDPRAKPDNSRVQPLVLWGYETSPFVKGVRERLCALCLPHVVIPCARGSPNRDALLKKTGSFQVPYLEDPNTGLALFESNEIEDYLREVYAVTSSIN